MKEDNEKFTKWLNTIPYGRYNSVRREIIKKCMISEDIFKNWRAKKSLIPDLAKPIIEEIAGRKIF